MMKKKKKNLPVIKIVKETEVTYYESQLEMDDDTYKMLVEWGKEEATDDDYVNIAMKAGLTNYINSKETDET